MPPFRPPPLAPPKGVRYNATELAKKITEAIERTQEQIDKTENVIERVNQTLENMRREVSGPVIRGEYILNALQSKERTKTVNVAVSQVLNSQEIWKKLEKKQSPENPERQRTDQGM